MWKSIIFFIVLYHFYSINGDCHWKVWEHRTVPSSIQMPKYKTFLDCKEFCVKNYLQNCSYGFVWIVDAPHSEKCHFATSIATEWRHNFYFYMCSCNYTVHENRMPFEYKTLESVKDLEGCMKYCDYNRFFGGCDFGFSFDSETSTCLISMGLSVIAHRDFQTYKCAPSYYDSTGDLSVPNVEPYTFAPKLPPVKKVCNWKKKGMYKSVECLPQASIDDVEVCMDYCDSLNWRKLDNCSYGLHFKEDAEVNEKCCFASLSNQKLRRDTKSDFYECRKATRAFLPAVNPYIYSGRQMKPKSSFGEAAISGDDEPEKPRGGGKKKRSDGNRVGVGGVFLVSVLFAGTFLL